MICSTCGLPITDPCAVKKPASMGLTMASESNARHVDCWVEQLRLKTRLRLGQVKILPTEKEALNFINGNLGVPWRENEITKTD